MIGIYRIVHLATGREYIGQSASIWKRWRSHKALLVRGAHHSPHLQRSWNKHGPAAFAFEVVELCAIEELTGREQAALDQRRPAFNVSRTAGSTRGVIPSAATRAKMSAVRKGRTLSPDHRQKISAANRGHVISEEQRRRLSEAHKGKTLSQGHREKMSVAVLGKKRSPETKLRMSEAARARWARAREAGL